MLEEENVGWNRWYYQEAEKLLQLVQKFNFFFHLMFSLWILQTCKNDKKYTKIFNISSSQTTITFYLCESKQHWKKTVW